MAPEKTAESPPPSSQPDAEEAPSKPPPRAAPPSVWDTLQPIFFNPSLKLTALRISDTKKSILYVVVLAFTFVHHVVSAFKWRFFIRVVDLILIIAEIVLLIFHSKFFKFDRFSPTSIIAVVIAIWSLVVCLIFLALCRIVAVIRKKGANLIKPFDLLEDSQRLKGLPIKTSPAAASILLGRSIWKTRFPGESNVVRLVRGVLGGIFILTIVIYGIVNVAIYPVRETALTPVKEYRVLGTPFDFPLEPPLWNIAFMRPLFGGYGAYNNVSLFREAVELIPLWDSASPNDTPECIHDPVPEIHVINAVTYQVIYSSCPPRTETPGLLPVQIYLPDLLVRVNFTTLEQPSAGTTANLWSSAIQVMPGLTKNKSYVIRTTTPITILPSTNNLAELEMEIRQIFKHPALSGLGMFESTHAFVTPRLKSVLPEPLVRTTPDNPWTLVGDNYSTLRMFLPDAISDTKIVEDYREKAVLDGFAVIGGLWTFLCAVFAIFFGISMTRIVFDMKPLSVFGIAQQFERETIVEEYFTHYPQIRSEIELPHRDRGLLTLFRDHLIDVELFKRYIEESEKEQTRIEDAEPVVEDLSMVDPTLRYRM
ncbi:hypothetical protein CVT24_002961 [Panaeolus cyanescens]|uniref:Uncharacterized protein n=1 Tax=Panaeolus cyanescens TaxID=181874 RepID=A0A409VPC5_9AGAR|nr:hypothetical protein CVT24_002961 [Panaeolus cyanescens]